MKVNLSGRRMVQPVKHAQQRGFSGSTFPDQDQRLTLRDVEVDVLKDSNVSLKLHRHVVDAQGRWVHHDRFFLDKPDYGYITKDPLIPLTDAVTSLMPFP